jgi:hypothetical protein
MCNTACFLFELMGLYISLNIINSDGTLNTLFIENLFNYFLKKVIIYFLTKVEPTAKYYPVGSNTIEVNN